MITLEGDHFLLPLEKFGKDESIYFLMQLHCAYSFPEILKRDTLETHYPLCLTWHSLNTLPTMSYVTLSKHITHYVSYDTL